MLIKIILANFQLNMENVIIRKDLVMRASIYRSGCKECRIRINLGTFIREYWNFGRVLRKMQYTGRWVRGKLHDENYIQREIKVLELNSSQWVQLQNQIKSTDNKYERAIIN